MSRKSVDDCRTQRDFVSVARQQGYRVENGGRHTCVVADGRRVPLGHANGEIPTGTRRAIIRALKAVGMTALVLGALYVMWVTM